MECVIKTSVSVMMSGMDRVANTKSRNVVLQFVNTDFVKTMYASVGKDTLGDNVKKTQAQRFQKTLI